MQTGDFGLLGNLTIVIVAAFIGGFLAHLLRLPPILGYLAAGLVVGPNTYGPTADVEQVFTVAELGVAFLMFGLGAQFSFRELASVRNIAIFGGAAQMLLTMALGFLLGLWLGLGRVEALFLGAITALSSTMVAISLISQRGQPASLYGRIAIGILIVQDLGAILMTVFLPALVGSESLWPALPIAIAKGVGLVLATFVLGTRIVPWLLQKVAEAHSRELFLLSVVSLALGAAIGSSVLGLSLAFGAFIAGLVVSESEFGQQTLAEILPLRDIFATVFFVAIGMLIDPAFIVQHPWEIAAVVLFATVAKFMIVAALGIGFRYPPRAAIGAGVGLAQMGEFSFVLVTVGLGEQLITEPTADLALSAVLITIVLSPFVFALHDRLVKLVERIAMLQPILSRMTVEDLDLPEEARLSRHAVICGYGATGRELVHALSSHGIPFIVIDHDPTAFNRAQRERLPSIYGDAMSPSVLVRAGVRDASLLAVAIPDPLAIEAAIATAKRLNPAIDVIARAAGPESYLALQKAGASEVVYPQFEAGLEFVRHTLQRFGVPEEHAHDFVDRRRIEISRARADQQQGLTSLL